MVQRERTATPQWPQPRPRPLNRTERDANLAFRRPRGNFNPLPPRTITAIVHPSRQTQPQPSTQQNFGATGGNELDSGGGRVRGVGGNREEARSSVVGESQMEQYHCM